jgi:hypothetical protein
MRVSGKVLVLLLLATTVSLSQSTNISSDDFVKLIPALREGYVFVGAGKLVAVRTEPIIWIGVSFEQITFDETDSTLVVWGHVFDDARNGKPAINNVQIMVGNFAVNVDDSSRAVFTARETRTLDSSSHFHESFKLKRNDYICFAMAEEKEIDIQSLLNVGNVERVMQTGWVKLYNVGRLLD